ncbi:hypothetical protein M426DRAFT_320100 [Hypoxylon sp. CI-4A]|nr:hypothetical protein M426DRAFT_320100 [Hypoxylon sp. CI-4A]
MDTMDLDVEMDVDVDLVADEPIIPEPEPQDAPGSRSPGEIDESADSENFLVPNKIHIRGLDVMNPEEVKAFVAEYFSEEPVGRIEWINDSSANLQFSSDQAASRALSSLTLEDISVSDLAQLPLQKLLPTKPFSKKPEVALQVRLAVATDKKQVGAASRSRFYLLNPEYDPEERRRRGETRRYRERDGDGYGRRRGRGSRNEEVEEQFDASLYDDDEAALSLRTSQSRPHRRRSYAPESGEDKRAGDTLRHDNRGKELFPIGTSGGNASRRRRSASPHDRDGDQAMDDFSNGGTSTWNHDQARAIKSRQSRSNRSRELFPEKSAGGGGRLGDEVEDATSLLAKGIMLPLMDKSDDTPNVVARKLADRITAPGGRLADRVSAPEDSKSSGFNIRGAASQRSADQGFAIKGNASKSAKELFPEKLGLNSKKELFADRVEGRSRQRQRAGDLFD